MKILFSQGYVKMKEVFRALKKMISFNFIYLIKILDLVTRVTA